MAEQLRTILKGTDLDSLLSCETRIFRPGYDGYEANAYQYAKTSHDGMAPNMIIYPTSLDEILKIVDWAKKKKIGVAVRTGGHQYSGASSTSGENIMVDLSDTFQDPHADIQYDEETNILRLGISFSLKEYYSLLAERGMFTPGGICTHVHLGGHVQTGGYGMLCRSFGLLSDHVEGFDIVLADGDGQGQARHVSVWKPNSEFASADQLIAGNDDLFWAVMGGSPGNFGILTHVRIRPRHDKDYPDSRMMHFNVDYTPERHRDIESIMTEMSADPELPRNYNYMITIMGPQVPAFDGPKVFEKKIKSGIPLNEDEDMMYRHGEQYGDGVDHAERGEGCQYDMVDSFGPLWRVADKIFEEAVNPQLIVYFSWINVNGEGETIPEEACKLFEKIRGAVGRECKIIDRVLDDPDRNINWDAVLKWKLGMNYKRVDYHHPIPVSKQMLLFSFNDIREFNQSSYKRTYLIEKYDMDTNGYLDWVVKRMEDLDNFASEHDYKVNVCLQNAIAGGIHSAYAEGKPELSAHSWRKEINYIMVLDVFYDPHDEAAKEYAQKWAYQNDVEALNFSEFDRRFLWSTFGTTSDPDQGAVLDTVWDKYFDSREKYDKLIAIKRRFDPSYVFTANALGVDATSAPSHQWPVITEK